MVDEGRRVRIYLAGEPYAHKEKNLYEMGVKNRLFTFYTKGDFIRAVKILKEMNSEGRRIRSITQKV
jgi:hypothetical protein